MMRSFLLVLSSLMMSVIGQYVLKVGATQIGRVSVEHKDRIASAMWSAATNPWILGGLASYGIGAAIWIMVLTRVPLSWAYPILALNQVLILFVAARFLGEEVSAARWLGVLLIVAGVFFTSRTQTSDSSVGRSIAHETVVATSKRLDRP
jgi:drug/metabolite transporter (DMT)-like permease